jgi:hypothetical protein
MSGESDYGRDVRRELFRSLPALAALSGVERYRAEELIERLVENAIGDWNDSRAADFEFVEPP